MKNLFLFIIGFCLLQSCNKSVYPTANVNYVSSSSGTITMNSIGFGNNQLDAQTDAEKNAIDVLLFRGLPGSQQTTPLIQINEADAKTKYNGYFTSFYNNKRYKTFITSTVAISSLVKNK